ncbi:MAG: HAD family hydrolase [Oscillospiraceae bacterium]|nr:HAD family hydrolase [Oscillospiraceae bacterium]
MSVTTVFFDLDGTLLPMDQDMFIRSYFTHLARKLAPHGYDPKKLYAAIWAGTGAMVANQGEHNNEEAFWQEFAKHFDHDVRKDLPLFEEFYLQDFPKVQESCGYSPYSAQVLALLKEKGIQAVLATNPIFPAMATRHRIRWAGLKEEDFLLFTAYENSRFCKPNLRYYEDILQKLDLDPQECLMVGNDVAEDMIARELGMEVFLLTDCMINTYDADISSYPQGGFPELLAYLEAL